MANLTGVCKTGNTWARCPSFTFKLITCTACAGLALTPTIDGGDSDSSKKLAPHRNDRIPTHEAGERRLRWDRAPAGAKLCDRLCFRAILSVETPPAQYTQAAARGAKQRAQRTARVRGGGGRRPGWQDEPLLRDDVLSGPRSIQ